MTDLSTVFQCEQARLDGGYRGAASGIFDPSHYAKQILGDLNYGSTFAYLFRRFGYPAYGWDDYKSLARYLLTTPMGGVLLSVDPNTSTFTSFGYMLRNDIYRRCENEMFRPVFQWIRKFKKWAAGRYRVIPMDQIYCPATTDDINRAGGAWLAKNYPEAPAVTKEMVSEFWAFKSAEYERLASEYSRIEPRFPRVGFEKWRELPETMLLHQVGTALCDAIRDLLRPTYVRDWYINIRGRVPGGEIDLVPDPEFPDDPDMMIPDTAGYSDMAGHGIGWDGIDRILSRAEA